jgi:hypothetical protein
MRQSAYQPAPAQPSCSIDLSLTDETVVVLAGQELVHPERFARKQAYGQQGNHAPKHIRRRESGLYPAS